MYQKVNKRYEESAKGRNTRRMNYLRKSITNRFKRYVKREMKLGTSFELAMDSVKTVIKTEYAAAGMEIAKVDRIVGNEYERIMDNYKQKVVGHGHD